MAQTPTEIAERLLVAFRSGPSTSRKALAELYAETVELRHVPPLAVDGPVAGASLAGSSAKEAAAIGSAISNQRYEDVDVSVDGEVVVVRATMSGVLADGSVVALPLQMRCAVGDGRIVGLEHVFDDGALRAWAEVAIAGGMKQAEALLDVE